MTMPEQPPHEQQETGQVLAASLVQRVNEARSLLSRFDEGESLATRGPGTWSRRQIIGHLIDSSVNNLHRFIRAQQAEELRFPDYDQPFWVDRGGYQERSWAELVGLWSALNLHLAAVIGRIPENQLDTPCRIGGSRPLTLGFIASDYLDHMNHHLNQILDPEGSKRKEHPPWG